METTRAAEHIRVLAILNYVWAGLSLLGLCGGAFYLALGGVFGAIPAKGTEEMSKDVAAGVMLLYGTACSCLSILGALAGYLSGRWMTQHRNRTFSYIVAALQCLAVPLGTVLGVFTFIVLSTAEADELYAVGERGASPPEQT